MVVAMAAVAAVATANNKFGASVPRAIAAIVLWGASTRPVTYSFRHAKVRRHFGMPGVCAFSMHGVVREPFSRTPDNKGD